MSIFGKTQYGHNLLSSFTPAGQSIFGVEGNGKYADYDIDIQVGDFNNVTEKNVAVGGLEGSFNIFNDNGKIRFAIFVNTTGCNLGEIVETVVHEFALHGSDIQTLINIYEDANKRGENGYAAAANHFKKDKGGKKDHENLSNRNMKDNATCTYFQVMNEILKKHPNFKLIFEQAIKNNNNK